MTRKDEFPQDDTNEGRRSARTGGPGIALLAGLLGLSSAGCVYMIKRLPERPDAFKSRTEFARTLIEDDYYSLAVNCGVIVRPPGMTEEEFEAMKPMKSYVSRDASEFFAKLAQMGGLTWETKPVVHLPNNAIHLLLFSALEDGVVGKLKSNQNTLHEADFSSSTVYKLAPKEDLEVLLKPIGGVLGATYGLRQSCVTWASSSSELKASAGKAAALKNTIEMETKESFRLTHYFGSFESPLALALDEPGLSRRRAALGLLAPYADKVLNPDKSYKIVRTVKAFTGQTYKAKAYDTKITTQVEASGSVSAVSGTVKADAGMENTSAFVAQIPWTVVASPLDDASFMMLPSLSDIKAVFADMVGAADIDNPSVIHLEPDTPFNHELVLRGVPVGLCKTGALVIVNPPNVSFIKENMLEPPAKPGVDNMTCALSVSGTRGDAVTFSGDSARMRYVVRYNRKIGNDYVEAERSLDLHKGTDISSYVESRTQAWVPVGGGRQVLEHRLQFRLAGATAKLDPARPIRVTLDNTARCHDNKVVRVFSDESETVLPNKEGRYNLNLRHQMESVQDAEVPDMEVLLAGSKGADCRITVTSVIPIVGGTVKSETSTTLRLFIEEREKSNDPSATPRAMARREAAIEASLAGFFSQSAGADH